MQHVRRAVVTIIIAIAGSQAAYAQTTEPRWSVSGLVQQEVVAIDGGEGTFTALGAAFGVRLTRYISLHGEFTGATGDANHAYQGVFVSSAPPNSSREEIDRLGVHLQRARTWRAGPGGGFYVSFHTPSSQQLGFALAVGLGGRSIELTDEKRVISLPEDWDSTRETGAGTTVSSRQHGGPFVGVTVPVRLGSHFAIAPELRLTHTLADEDYTVRAIGMRATWMF